MSTSRVCLLTFLAASLGALVMQLLFLSYVSLTEAAVTGLIVSVVATVSARSRSKRQLKSSTGEKPL